jgi:hypothetical protein
MRATILVIAAALPAIAHAQQGSQPSPPREAPPGAAAPKPASPAPRAARELARALLPEQRWDRLLDSYASSLSGQVSQALQSRGEEVPDGLEDRIRSELGERLRYEQTVEAQAKALAAELTPDELKKTLAFYSTPAGKKVVEKLPEAQAEASRELQERLTVAVPEILEQVAPKALAPPDPLQGGDEPGKEPRTQGRRPPDEQRR